MALWTYTQGSLINQAYEGRLIITDLDLLVLEMPR